MGLYGVAYLGVGATPWFVLALALVVLAHLGGGANWTMSNFALQAEVPDELRGRVFATDLMIVTLAMSVSQLAVGVFVDRVSARPLVAACGGLTALYAVVWRLATMRLTRRVADPAGEPKIGVL
jgi:MFS family permease